MAVQSRGADPSIRTEEYDPYLNPGHHLPIDIACEDEGVRAKLLDLDKKYADTPKVCLNVHAQCDVLLTVAWRAKSRRCEALKTLSMHTATSAAAKQSQARNCDWCNDQGENGFGRNQFKCRDIALNRDICLKGAVA